MTAEWVPTATDSPYLRMGGDAGVRAMVARFYDAMDAHEPELAALHERDAQGRVSEGVRDRLGLFFIGWLGGPQDYIAQHGHPRLRMRHMHVRVDISMRDAWMRCLNAALAIETVTPEVRQYLEQRLAGVADFLRNVPE